MVLLGNGWHDEEFDGKRFFIWSSDKFSIEIDPEEGKNALRFFAGTDISGRKMGFYFGDQGFECETSIGWVNYYVPYSGSDSMEIRIEPLEIEEEERKLGIMVSMMELVYIDSTRDEIYTTPEVTEEYNFKDTTIFTVDKLKSKYIDIVYRLNEPRTAKVQLTELTSDLVKTFDIIDGGDRTITYETESEDTLRFEMSVPSDVSFKINSVVNRNNYFDYLNLSSVLDYRKAEKEWQVSIENEKGRMLSIQWFVSWKCNYTCHYCWQEVTKELYRRGKWKQRDPKDWAKIFNKFHPLSLYFTGGEPTLYRELPELISLLKEDILLSITTNFSETLDLDNWFKKVPKNRFDLFFVSFHPTQIENLQEFYDKADRYIDHYGPEGFGIEMVIHKDNMSEGDRLLKFCEERNILSALDPFIPPTEAQAEDRVTGSDIKKIFGLADSSNVAGVRYEKDQLKGTGSFDTSILKIKKSSRFLNKILVPADTSLKLERKTEGSRLPIFCPAGKLRFVMDDVGDVYTCMSAIDRNKLFGEHAMPHYKSLGNVFDGTFKRLSKPVVCWESFRCSACDVDAIDRFWKPIDNEFDYQLPIPE